MAKQLSLKLAMLAAGAALGFGAAHWRHGPSPSPSDPAARTSALQSPPSPANDALEEAAEGATSQLKTILSQKSEREAILWIRSRCGSWESGDFAAAAADALAFGVGRSERVLGELIENWALIHPKDALAFLDTLPSGIERDLFFQFASSWAEVDPDGLLAWTKEQKNINAFKYYHILSALAPYRPDEALKLAEAGLPNQSQQVIQGKYQTLLGSLSVTNPNKALQLFNTLSEKDQKESISQLFMGWSRTDPDAATAWITGLPKGPVREHGFQMIIHFLSLSSPKEAVEMAMREVSSSQNALNLTYSLVHRWLQSDPAEAHSYFSQLPDSPIKQSAMQLLQRDQAHREPLEYLNALVEKQDFSQDARQWANTAVMALARKDPEAYAQWFEKNVADIPLDNVSYYVWGPASEDPKLSARLLAMLPEGRQTDNTYQMVASQWAQKDLNAARNFLATLPEGTARDQFEAGLIGSFASSDLAGALLEAGQISDPKRLSTVVTQISYNTERHAEVASWVSGQPENAETPSMYRNVVNQWARRDANAAGEWVTKLPEGAGKEAAIQSYASQIASNDPTTALQWAHKIKNDRQRERALINIVTRWSQADETAAAAWVKESTLPDNIKKNFIKN